MSALVKALLAGGLIVAIAIVAVNSHNETVDGLEYENARTKLRAAFAERTAWVHAVPEEDRYRDELNAATKWYASEVAAIYNRFPGKKAPEAAIEEMEKQAEEGTLKGADLALRKEFFEETKRFNDMMKNGTYNPFTTQVQSGIRLDLVSLQRVQHEGKSRLRLDVAVWGAPRREEITKSADGKSGTAHIRLDFALKGLSLEFIDESQKADPNAKKPATKVAMAPGRTPTEPPAGLLLGGGETGAPELLVEYPERWNTDVPPQFAIGHWWLDPMPRETTKVVLVISGEARSPVVGTYPVTYEWTLSPKSDWKLRDGETFDGEERIMAEEELKR